MTRKPDPKKEEQKILIRKLRKTPKYRKWKKKILRRDGWSIVDKGIQVHHKKELTHLLNDNNITKLEQALSCYELWRINNGVTLKRGEHFILTKLRRYKYLTKGFVDFIHEWLKTSQIRLSETHTCGYLEYCSMRPATTKLGSKREHTTHTI